jgi:hypothetical protein
VRYWWTRPRRGHDVAGHSVRARGGCDRRRAALVASQGSPVAPCLVAHTTLRSRLRRPADGGSVRRRGVVISQLSRRLQICARPGGCYPEPSDQRHPQAQPTRRPDRPSTPIWMCSSSTPSSSQIRAHCAARSSRSEPSRKRATTPRKFGCLHVTRRIGSATDAGCGTVVSGASSACCLWSAARRTVGHTAAGR